MECATSFKVTSVSSSFSSAETAAGRADTASTAAGAAAINFFFIHHFSFFIYTLSQKIRKTVSPAILCARREKVLSFPHAIRYNLITASGNRQQYAPGATYLRKKDNPYEAESVLYVLRSEQTGEI